MSSRGHPLPGTHAEYVTVPAGNVRPLPAGWSLADAGALPLAGLTAWRAHTRIGQLSSGEKALVTGASGGVSTFLIDLARDLGATVYVTTSTHDKLDVAMAAGAACGVLHGDADWHEQLRQVHGGGIDLAVDSAGDLNAVLRTLEVAGRLVTLGRTAVREASVDVGEVFLRHLRILGTTMGSPRDFDDLLAHVATVPWRPRIDSVWPSSRYADALDRLTGGHAGKMLLEVGVIERQAVVRRIREAGAHPGRRPVGSSPAARAGRASNKADGDAVEQGGGGGIRTLEGCYTQLH